MEKEPTIYAIGDEAKAGARKTSELWFTTVPPAGVDLSTLPEMRIEIIDGEQCLVPVKGT